MDKTAIKTFAINSRNKLIEDVEYKMSLVGIYENEIKNPSSSANGVQTFQIGNTTQNIYDKDIEKRERLVKEVEQKGFNNIVEEVAYTWFNRIIAIRFLEINNYLPTKTRVLSSEIQGKIEPDIITDALDIDLNYSHEDKELIFKLKDENKLDELFRFLFIKQCNKLNEILPGLFEKTDDFLELLLNISFTNEEGVVRQLIDTIPEEDFNNQVEIIGWLYQFYNSELKDETFANLKKRIKISKERIPAATQLFTPDWIVKYMVENSLGRLWLEGHPNEELESKWKYYVEEASQNQEVESELIKIKKESESLKPEDIKIIDPCMGSGHILVYIFEVLMDLYVSEGYTEKDSAESILKNNLYGLDIDDRAYQLAYFAVMMKARNYNRRILKKNIKPLVSPIKESNNISDELIELICSKNPKIKKDLLKLINLFKNAKNYGSLINVSNVDLNEIKTIISNFEIKKTDLNYSKYLNELNILKIIVQNATLMAQKYDVVVTNPPYMGNSGMNPELKDYIKSNYPLSKSDLFAVFIEKGFEMIKELGFNCMVTMQSWMFLSSFEKFRKHLIESYTISNLLHMDNMVMKIAFGTSATVFRKISLNDFNSTFYHVALSDVKNDIVNPLFFNDKNLFVIKQSNFVKIPGYPVAYWVSENFINTFEKGVCIDNISGHTGSQNKTANNEKYLRYFWEVSYQDIGRNNKWIFYAKGGDFKKYYGNLEYVVDWSNDARNFYKNNPTSNLLDEKYWYKEGITYTKISSKGASFRYLPPDCIFDMGGPSICYLNDNLLYVLGLLNSNIVKFYLNIFNPTINIQSKDIRALPIIIKDAYKSKIEDLVKFSLEITKLDYESFETSYSFKKHPFVLINNPIMEEILQKLEKDKLSQLNKIISNEKLLNEIFLEIYDVEDVSSEVNENDIKLNLFNYEDTVKSFISYAVGCMFGRYSLDNEGLQFAGGEFNINNYDKFIPDDDNIIPVLDTAYFEDDIVGRFVEFVKVCFGDEHLEENLDFIANVLSKTKKPSREKIRDYLLKNFFNDHKKTYKKCPIYWQFSSGKENGFNCLVYMHRYEPSLVARIRTDYLHKTQKALEQAISNADNILENSSSSSEIAKATKDKNKLQKQLKETQEYDEALAHIANQNIEIDLDDGVKVNYAKFQNIEVSKEGSKIKKINILKKL